MQAIGNTYDAFVQLDIENNLIMKLFQLLFMDGSDLWHFRIVAFINGGILPIIAFLFIKAIAQYLTNEDDEDLAKILEEE